MLRTGTHEPNSSLQPLACCENCNGASLLPPERRRTNGQRCEATVAADSCARLSFGDGLENAAVWEGRCNSVLPHIIGDFT